MIRRPLPLIVTPGDPKGIGPEVAGKALARFHRPVVLIGDAQAVRPWLASVRVLAEIPRPGGPAPTISMIDPGDDGEPVEVTSLRLAVMACLSGRARGIVTGPIHKARLASQGFRHPGHTEFLGALCGVERPVMAFVGGAVRVSLVTVHVPLRAVPSALTTDLVLHTLQTTDRAARSSLGLPHPRIAVCGLNPHAGDEGLLGSEEGAIISPAVRAAAQEGIDARGPISAETAFREAVRGEVDWVVAMYHDQGLVPLKALQWAQGAGATGRSVNWTLGLPIVRVGVDHGTADDIAGKGIADEGSMLAALELADRLADPQSPAPPE